MLVDLRGLVIRTISLADNDKLITLITAEKGKITVCGKGIRSIKSRNISATQLFCYSSFVLYRKGDYFWLREADLIESFYPLRSDMQKMALAAYICDVANDVALEGEQEEELLRLILNTLHLTANSQKPPLQIKATFELRCASQLGFMPDLSACHVCGRTDAEYMSLQIMNGCLLCPDCRAKGQGIPDYDGSLPETTINISKAALCAMRYIINSTPERLFAFSLEESELPMFAQACEKYLLNHLERGFQTLDFYRTVSD